MKKLIQYFKATPTEYCRISVGGKTKQEGKGVSKLIIPYRTNVEIIDTSLTDKEFTFVETTNDNQQVTIQGSFTYKVIEPKKVLEQYNLAVNPKTKTYIADEQPEVGNQLIHLIRGNAREKIQTEKMEDVLIMGEKLSKEVSENVKKSKIANDLGLVVNSLYITAITAEPIIAKALGATYREKLLTTAQEAEYSRRAKAVEQEKEIEENQMNNQISLETQRKKLIELEAKNSEEEGKYKAKVLEMELKAYENMDAEKLKAHALLKIGEKAERIENLNITPELLSGIKQYVGKDA